mgnify:CR=1 FL=1
MENLTLRAVCPEDRDDEAIYFMLQHLGRKENGFDNPGNALTRAQFPA